ncbi:MAG: hypothetical protein J6S21_06305, partial [Victivallales bacterium]|nr:hypothetical protein [Victivallales bacterium]
MMRKTIPLFLLSLCLTLTVGAVQIASPNCAFWADRIEIRGNENLYFQPRLPYFPSKPGDRYELQVTVPDFLEYDAETVESLLPLTEGGGFTVLNRELRIEHDGNGRNVITIVPELEPIFGFKIGRTVRKPLKVTFEVRGRKVPDGVSLTCENVPDDAERNAYGLHSSGFIKDGRIVREMQIADIPAGDYEWTKVEAVWNFPILCSGIILRLRGKGGTVDIRNFQLYDADGGKYCSDSNFRCKAAMPSRLLPPQYLEDGGIRCDLNAASSYVIPFGEHTASFLGEALREVRFAPLLAFKQRTPGTGTLTWEVKLNGKTMQQGKMSLEREAAPTAVPDME